MTKKETIAAEFKKFKTTNKLMRISDEKVKEITKLSCSKSTKSIKWYLSKIRTGKSTVAISGE